MMRLALVVMLSAGALTARAAADGKPCVKVLAGNDSADHAAKGSYFAVRYGVRPAKPVAKATFADGAFEVCLPKGRYSIVAVTTDNREGAVDIDVTRDKDTFLFLDGQRLSGDRVEQCLGPATATTAMPACDTQRGAQCSIRGEVKNAKGEAKAYARVSVIVDRGPCYPPDMELDGEVANLVTDAQGQFELSGLACYAATVMAWTPSTCQASYVTFAQPGAQSVSLAIKD